MDKESFLNICPPFAGEILWEHLDRLKAGKNFSLLFMNTGYCVINFEQQISFEN